MVFEKKQGLVKRRIILSRLAVDLTTMKRLAAAALDQLFRKARTHNAWLLRPVPRQTRLARSSRLRYADARAIV
jgi:hypothetical protein